MPLQRSKPTVPIRIVNPDEEIAACHPAMAELRPHIALGEFLPQVRRRCCQPKRKGAEALSRFEGIGEGPALFALDLPGERKGLFRIARVA